MDRTWKTVAAALATWNALLAWYGYVQARETQRMLCHAIWKHKSVLECGSDFTGSSLAYMIVLGVGSVLGLVVVGALLLRSARDDR